MRSIVLSIAELAEDLTIRSVTAGRGVQRTLAVEAHEACLKNGRFDQNSLGGDVVFYSFNMAFWDYDGIFDQIYERWKYFQIFARMI